jgi:spore maturation protein CgeB
MRFLILDYDYVEFLDWLFAQHPRLEKQPYEEQMRARMGALFGLADFYSSNLRKLGHEAYDIRPVDEPLQRRWAREHGTPVTSPYSWEFRWRRQIVPWWSGVRNRKWVHEVVAAQIKHYKPDVLLNQTPDCIRSSFLKEMKSSVRLLVGQIASPLPRGEDFSAYDLIISSLPNQVNHFRGLGVASELHRLGFEPSLLPRLKRPQPRIPISFAGGLSPSHQRRLALLEHVCLHVDAKVWTGDVTGLPPESSIRNRYMGNAWGIEMYEIMKASQMTLNCHIDVAESYANNQRLFEATGVGTLLVTDMKQNLHEMFEPGKEVVTYRTPEECVEVIKYYLEHVDEGEAIARAGRERTLREHTYHRRMQELIAILRKYL